MDMIDPTTKDGFRTHVSEQRFDIMRQPIFDLKSNSVHHYEWLVRFKTNHGNAGVLGLAEKSGAIKDLDLSMLIQAILVLNENPDSQAIAINLSGASVDKPKFKKSFLACLSALKTAPNKLMIELTETWDMRELEPALDLLQTLRERGHHICLDDVGAGAASIRYLRALPADWLKIDGDFIASAMASERERAILTALLSLRDPLNVKFIAEGIETAALLKFVQDMNFDAAQGYLLGKPEKEIRIF